MKEPLIIKMQHSGVQCCVCGAYDEPKWGIPVSCRTAAIVSIDFDGEWAAKPACRHCYLKHEDGAFVGQYPKF